MIYGHALSLPRGPGWIVLFNWGGAVSRPQADTPIANREARWVVHPGVFWEDPARTRRYAAGCEACGRICGRTPPAACG